MKLRSVVFILLGAWLLAPVMAAPAGAQELSANARTGTIQQLRQFDGYIVISGRSYGFDAEVTRTYLRDEQISDALLEEGMVVRFTLADNLLTSIVILGPASMIELIGID